MPQSIEMQGIVVTALRPCGFFTAKKYLTAAAIVVFGRDLEDPVTDAAAIELFTGDLSAAEIAQIQGVVNRAGRPLEVVGSAAQGTRTAGRDIDYVVPPSSLPYYEGLEGELPGIDPEHGIIPGTGNPNIGRVIRFEPTDDEMKKFWFKVETIPRPTAINLGCGITATDRQDADTLFRERIQSRLPNARSLQVYEIMSINDLEAKHVRPNIGNMDVRGVWFPQGY